MRIVKRYSFFILCAILCAATHVSAQRRKAATKKPAVPALELAQQAMTDYDFERAEEILTKEIAALAKKKQATDKAEAMLHAAMQANIKLHATERIVFIDSLVCNRNNVLQAIAVSRENGRIDTYASTYHTSDTLGATLYENELANKRYLAVPSTNAHKGKATLRLAVTDKIGEQWSTPTLLSGLNDDDLSQNFPFLLSDGVTLYYAATGPESMGGMDIFVSRADGEDGSFLAPENIGFPFNSTANDFLMAIDELNQLGWFVSDRRQPEGKVCVYTFIPNTTREVYADEVSPQTLRSRARITSIKDTWELSDSPQIEAAQQRLTALRSGKGAASSKKNDFQFVIDDSRTYTTLSDFRSPKAKSSMQQWLKLNKDSQTEAVMLQRLRDNYATAKPAERQQLRTTILQLEEKQEVQAATLRQLAKEIRNEEIQHK